MEVTKGIHLVTQLTEYLLKHKFDAFEVHPCRAEEEPKGGIKQAVYQCEPAEAQFWSVYVHYVGGGLDCIADCDTEQLANELVDFLKVLIKQSEIK